MARNKQPRSQDPDAVFLSQEGNDANFPPPPGQQAAGNLPGGAYGGHVPEAASLVTTSSPRPIFDPEVEALARSASKKYRAMNGGYVNIPGHGKTTVKAGKLFDSNTYDIEVLRAQGIVLKEVEADATASPPPGL